MRTPRILPYINFVNFTRAVLKQKRNITVTDIPFFLKIAFFLVEIPLFEKKTGIFGLKNPGFWT